MRDRYERKHRRTHRHPESVTFMASADFDKVPPLAEAIRGCIYSDRAHDIRSVLGTAGDPDCGCARCAPMEGAYPARILKPAAAPLADSSAASRAPDGDTT